MPEDNLSSFCYIHDVNDVLHQVDDGDDVSEIVTALLVGPSDYRGLSSGGFP